LLILSLVVGMGEEEKNEIQEIIMKDVETRYFIKPIDHEINIEEVKHLKTMSDVIIHVSSILSDVQEMVNAGVRKEDINEEINEAKYFLFVILEYLIKKEEQ